MIGKPRGLYVVVVVNLLFAIGVLVFASMTGYYGGQNAGPGSDAFPSLAILVGIEVLFALLFLDASYATYRLKKRARLENTILAVVLFSFAGMLLLIDFSPQGKTPAITLPTHGFAFLYALWNMYYMRRAEIKSLFVS